MQDKGAQVGRATARSGYGRGAAAAVSALATGAALLGAVCFAVPAVRAGALAGVLLAVVVLTPLAAHEVFAGLGPAAQEIPRLRASADRVAEVLARPAPVAEPSAPVPLPAPPYHLAARGLTVGWRPGEPVLRDVCFDVPAGSRVAIVGPSGSGKTTLALVLLRFLDYGAAGPSGAAGRNGDTRTASTSGRSPPTTCARSSACASRTPTSSTPPSRPTCGWRSRTRPMASSATRSPAPGCSPGPTPCRRA